MPNHSDDATRAWDLMEKIRICMLTTQAGDELRSRPMFAHIDRTLGAIYFLTDVNNHKDEEIDRHPNICLSFADTNGREYVSVSGRASVSNDRQKIKYLWSTRADTWLNSEEDPSIRVLTIKPTIAEYWDTPGTIVSSIKMITAAIVGERPDMDDHAEVTL